MASNTTTTQNGLAVAYTRFSTPQQAEGTSKSRQAKAAQDWCEKNGYRLDDGSFEDLGVSAFHGRHRTHGALGAFVDAAAAGVFPPATVLLIENPDRLSRQGIRASTRLLEEILETGVEVVFLTTGLRITPESLDRLDTAIIIMVEAHRAAEESRRKSELLRGMWSAKRRALEAGNGALGKRGPSWLRRSGTGWSIVEPRAEIVRRIYRERANGRGYAIIARGLNADDVPTFRSGPRGRWCKSTIVQLLASKAPIGTLVYGPGRDPKNKRELPDFYPPIVDKDLWDRAQAAAVETTPGSRFPVRSPFGYGLSFCSACGSTMGTKTHHGHDAKRINSHERFLCKSYREGSKKCPGSTTIKRRRGRVPSKSVPLREVISALRTTLPEVLAAAPSVEHELTARLEAAEGRVLSLEGEIVAILGFAGDDRLMAPGSARASVLDRLSDQLDAAQAEVNQLTEAAREATGPLLRARLERLRLALSEGTDVVELGVALRAVFRRMTFRWEDEHWIAEWRHAAGVEVVFPATVAVLSWHEIAKRSPPLA